MNRIVALSFSLVVTSTTALAQVQPEVFTLDNGMKFILLPRSEEPNSVAAGWVAKVGSVNEHPGITGISHFFEHLMFKGTDTIGTSDAGADRAFTETERGLRNKMLEIIWGEQYDRFKQGDIDDPWDELNDTPRLAELRKELLATMEDHRSVIVKDEFVSVYQGEGATGLNAFTSEDVTFFINQLPANKLELWCWMESDRLANSVFREFFSERDVVHEERRMRTESSPTGEYDEQFNSMYWQASPYSWPVIGWPSDLNSYTLEEAQRYFDIYYRPNNLVGVLVGDFDVENARRLIEEYFGKLERGSIPPPPVPTIEPNQKAPQRMQAEVDAQSMVEVRYHGVPAGHKDGYVFEIISAVLNGKTGRLYKTMVEGSEIAASASAGADAKKYAGSFSFSGSVKGEASPLDLEEAWYKQLELLQSEPVSDRELEKVKNNVVADQYRSLQSNFFLMIQLGYMEALGGWEYINTSKDRLLAVTADDIMRVASSYLTTKNSSVVAYFRSKNAAPVDDELAEFTPQQRTMITQTMKTLNQLPDEELRGSVAEMTAQANQIPEEFKPVFDYLLKKLKEKVDALPETQSVVDTPETQSVVDTPEPPNQTSPAVEDYVTEAPQPLVLTPQQKAEADLFLASLGDKSIEDVKRVYEMLQASAAGIPEQDRPFLEFVLAKLAVYIAETE